MTGEGVSLGGLLFYSVIGIFAGLGLVFTIKNIVYGMENFSARIRKLDEKLDELSAKMKELNGKAEKLDEMVRFVMHEIAKNGKSLT
ncbi:hypothetical protein [Bacteroides heparinolyticus]|uniref:hypothetical protein n=1 Tax=Prevotella heparinolytica TaxID=28113 RepID=UPI00359FCC7D